MKKKKSTDTPVQAKTLPDNWMAKGFVAGPHIDDVRRNPSRLQSIEKGKGWDSPEAQGVIKEQLRKHIVLEKMYESEVEVGDINAENLIKSRIQLKEADQLLLEMWKASDTEKQYQPILYDKIREYLTKHQLI